MKRAIADGSVLWLLGCSLFAQVQPTDPILVTTPLQEIRRAIPPELGGGTAVRVVSFDPDGDLLHDLAILWSNGDLTFAYAPEVMSAFVACPVAAATGVARIPAAAALPGACGHDALLVANGSTLGYLTFDPTMAWSSTATTCFTLAPVVADSAWQQVVKVEAFLVGSTCWLLGLAADQHTIHIGVWGTAGITDSGLVVAGSNVQQLLVVDFCNAGQPQVVARTVTGLEMWDVHGAAACAPILAPTSSAIGAMTSLHDGPVQRLAWVVLSGSRWLLRVYFGPVLQQESALTAPDFMPDRFRPISIGAMPIDADGTDALVLDQTSTAWQLALVKNADAEYQPACAFEFTGITYPVDTCPAILDDINNDGCGDCTTVLSSPRCVQIDTGLPVAVKHVLRLEPLTSDYPDFLPVDCTMSRSNRTSSQPDDTIDLRVLVPPEYVDDGIEAQVVAWPEFVAHPAGSNDGYGAEPIGAAMPNVLFGLTDNSGHLVTQPILSLELVPEPDGQWSPCDEYYLLVRLIRRSGSTILWSSPSQLVGFVANYGSAPPTAFLVSISSGSGHGQVTVQGGNRNVGVIQKPDHMDPPSSTLKVPDAGQASPGSYSGTWQ